MRDREIAEIIAKFRTPPNCSWRDLANDIETVLKSRPASAGAPEVEVTPAMIAAGASAFDLADIRDVWEGDLRPEVLVEQIYTAMTRARLPRFDS